MADKRTRKAIVSRMVWHDKNYGVSTQRKLPDDSTGLRNFRMDKKDFVKGQISLLRYFRNEGYTGSQSEESQKSTSQSSGTETNTSLILHRKKLMNLNDDQEPRLTKFTALSKPLFVGAPSPEREINEEETDDDDSEIKEEERSESLSSDEPMETQSTKACITNAERSLRLPDIDEDSQDEAPPSVKNDSTSEQQDEGSEQSSESVVESSHIKQVISSMKRALCSSDVEQDSQDSPAIRMDTSQDLPVWNLNQHVKRARLVVSGNEEEDVSKKKEQLNGHSSHSTDNSKATSTSSVPTSTLVTSLTTTRSSTSTSTSPSLPTPFAETIENFLDKCESIYTSIPRMHVEEIEEDTGITEQQNVLDVCGDTGQSSPPTDQPLQRTTKRQKVNKAERTMECALNQLQTMTHSSHTNKDDSYCMAMLVEKDLRCMEPQQRSIAKKIISDVLFLGNMGLLTPAVSQQVTGQSWNVSQQDT